MSSSHSKRLLTATAFLGLVLAITWGAIAQPYEASPALPRASGALPPIRGFSMQISDPEHLAAYKHSIITLERYGISWLNIVFQAHMKHVTSNHVYWNKTLLPSPAQMTNLLLYARKHHFHTMVMPIFLIDNAVGDEWRGAIKPANWNTWFASYRRYIKMCARAAQLGHAAIFSVGSELLTTEKFENQWLRIVHDVRERFHGKLTYSANWDHYQYVRIWNKLDYIGMNAYYQLARHPGYSVEHIEKSWQPVKHHILRFAKQHHKPMFFTEIGWDNLQNTIMAPWDYIGTGPMDPNEQRRAYEAFAGVWRGISPKLFAGAFIWEWVPGAKPGEYGSYSLQGQPALPVVLSWVAGPPKPPANNP